MASTWWSDDERLVAALDEALREGYSVPPDFIAAGRAAYAWRDIDTDLAALVYDSRQEPALTRSADTAALRALTFATARLTVELEITPDGLVGQLVPPAAAVIEVRTAGGGTTGASADELGCFTIRPLPVGPFQLHCQVSDGPDMLTNWITL